MTTDPTSLPVETPPDRLATFLIAQRTIIAWVMIALGLASAGAAIFSASKLLATPPSAAKDADKDKDLTKDVEAPPTAAPVPFRTEYTLGVLGGVLGAVACLGVGAWIFAAPPKLTFAERATDARVATLLAGAAAGLTLMVVGLTFFIVWFPLLVKWLDEKVTPPGAWKMVAALLVFLVGAGLAFVAAQPARAEERNAPNLRRLVYGLNFALGILLLLVVLIAGNAFAALKMPAKLDTTESGFNTLSDATKQYLTNLTEPVTAYILFPNSSNQVEIDTRNLVAALQAVNPAKIQVRSLSEGLNRGEISQLKPKYPTADLNEYGVLLTSGEDGKRFAYVPMNELVTREPDPAGRGMGSTVFRGEAKIVQELLSITENTAKTVIYFTQSSNELAIAPGADAADPKRAAMQLKTLLEKGFADVRPLPSGAGDMKVPDDATVVVIADPTQPLPERQVAAIRDFVVGGPRGDGKKGKLVVLAGAHSGLDGKMTGTGLDGLLGEFGIKLGTNFVYHAPLDRIGATTALVVPGRAATQSKNPIALAVSGYGALPMDDVRLVDSPPSQPGGKYTTQTLLYTMPRMQTWLEPERIDAVAFVNSLEKLNQQDAIELFTKKQVSEGPRPVAAIVTEEQTPRAVVIGSGEFFADQTARQLGGQNIQAELFAAVVNWLRDRPPVANIATKTYGVYTLNPTVSNVPLVWLPIGVTLTGVLALGLGVWLLRRM